VGSREAVDALVDRARAAGVPSRSVARTTGDGYYEAVLDDPDGNPVEVTGGGCSGAEDEKTGGREDE
jgi:lactoylglutathione lyase